MSLLASDLHQKRCTPISHRAHQNPAMNDLMETDDDPINRLDRAPSRYLFDRVMQLRTDRINFLVLRCIDLDEEVVTNLVAAIQHVQFL